MKPRRAGPRRKTRTRPTIDPLWSQQLNVGGVLVPWVDPSDRLDVFERRAEDGDAIAVLGAVRHCQASGEPVPQWVVRSLELLVVEFLVVAVRGGHLESGSRAFRAWGRDYLAALGDLAVCDHVEGNQQRYGMTFAEACDEAACYFRGTKLEGSTTSMRKAYQRTRRRTSDGWFQRDTVPLEGRISEALAPRAVSVTSPRNYWWIINHDRIGDARGEWRRRPRRVASLRPADLEREARAVLDRWALERAACASSRRAAAAGAVTRARVLATGAGGHPSKRHPAVKK